MGWSNLPSSSISPRLRDSLRLDGGVNIVNTAAGSPARHFAFRKTGIRVTGNDRDEEKQEEERTVDGEGENFARKTRARRRKRGTVDGVGQSRGSSVPVKLNYAGSAARTKLLARI